jgi:hypothetical protein
MESPAESIAFKIPMCARPFAPPPLNVSPIFGLFFKVESCATDGMPKPIIKQQVINRVRTVSFLKIENLKI